MSYKREINRYGSIKHIVKEDDNLIIGIFNGDLLKCLERNFNYDEIIYLFDREYFNTIKSKAVCKEPEIFNKNTGLDIVDLKILLKHHNKMIRIYQKAFSKLLKLIAKIKVCIKEEEETVKNIKEELNKF